MVSSPGIDLGLMTTALRQAAVIRPTRLLANRLQLDGMALRWYGTCPRQSALEGLYMGRSGAVHLFHSLRTRNPLCDIPSGCCFFTGPWTVTRSSLRMLRRVAAFCRPLRPVLLLVSFPRSRSPVCWCVGAVRDVAGCAVCVSAAPNNWPSQCWTA